MAEFKIINTQEEFDAAIKDRLEREQAKYADYERLKAKAGEADGMKKKLEAAEAKMAKLEADAAASAEKLKEVETLTSRATAAEKALLQMRVAQEFHLPAELAGRLAGDTEEELRADAKTMSQYVSMGGAAPLFQAEAGGGKADPFGKGLGELLTQLNTNNN